MLPGHRSLQRGGYTAPQVNQALHCVGRYATYRRSFFGANANAAPIVSLPVPGALTFSGAILASSVLRRPVRPCGDILAARYAWPCEPGSSTHHAAHGSLGEIAMRLRSSPHDRLFAVNATATRGNGFPALPCNEFNVTRVAVSAAGQPAKKCVVAFVRSLIQHLFADHASSLQASLNASPGRPLVFSTSRHVLRHQRAMALRASSARLTTNEARPSL